MALTQEEGNARHIVCFGNEWHGDDGFGFRVYEYLDKLPWPRDVKVYYAGIAGLNALRLLEECRQAILVDALANGGKIGEVCVFRPEIMTIRYAAPTGHGLGIPYLLQALRAMRDPLPDILVVGAEIGAIEPFSPGLSGALEQAVRTAVHLIRNLLPE